MAANLTVDMLLKVSVFIDIVRDTSDTEWYSEGEGGEDVEYEPESETDEEKRGPISEESSGQTDVSLHKFLLNIFKYSTTTHGR